jgi:hypothetical protein
VICRTSSAFYRLHTAHRVQKSVLGVEGTLRIIVSDQNLAWLAQNSERDTMNEGLPFSSTAETISDCVRDLQDIGNQINVDVTARC